MIRLWFSLRLHTQLALAGGILLAVTISVVTWLNIETRKQELIHNTTSEAAALVKSLSIIGTHFVLTGKYDELESLLIQTAAFPGISGLKITSADGQTLSHVKKLGSGEVVADYDLQPVHIPATGNTGTISKINWETNQLVLWQPITTSSLIGWVEMQVSLNDVVLLQEEIIKDNIKGAITAIVLDILIIVLILYNPARVLRKVVQFASTLVDKPGALINFPGGSLELDNLIQALNESSTKLQAQQSLIFKKTEMLERMASHDKLTQIPNRSVFMDRLENSIRNAKRNQTELVVIFLDLNDFKPVNDIYGHHTGDKLLQQFAARLQSCIRESDSLARYGGDEFIVLLTNITSKASLTSIVDNLRSVVSAAYDIDGKTIEISTSIGLASYPSDGTRSDQLLTTSDQNMYRAKREHKKKRA